MTNPFDMANLADALATEEDMKPLFNLIDQIMALPDEQLNDNSIKMIKGMIGAIKDSIITPAATEQTIRNFESQGLNKMQVNEIIKQTKNGMDEIIAELKPSKYKEELLDEIFSIFYGLLETAAEKYHSYDIELPILLEEGAQMPTYAHEGDVAADLYALETIVVKANTISNKIRTGIHLQLPEGWCARLEPRSSIGSKTPLRMSNAQGIIDQLYTGEVLVLYDNVSDSDYTINAGDRIAQMWVEPIYRFRPVQIDKLQETERGDQGFGSTGK